MDFNLNNNYDEADWNSFGQPIPAIMDSQPAPNLIYNPTYGQQELVALAIPHHQSGYPSPKPFPGLEDSHPDGVQALISQPGTFNPQNITMTSPSRPNSETNSLSTPPPPYAEHSVLELQSPAATVLELQSLAATPSSKRQRLQIKPPVLLMADTSSSLPLFKVNPKFEPHIRHDRGTMHAVTTLKNIRYGDLDFGILLPNSILSSIDILVWTYHGLNTTKADNFSLQEAIMSLCRSFVVPLTKVMKRSRNLSTNDHATQLAVHSLKKICEISTEHGRKLGGSLFMSSLLPVPPETSKEPEINLKCWFINQIYPPAISPSIPTPVSPSPKV